MELQLHYLELLSIVLVVLSFGFVITHLVVNKRFSIMAFLIFAIVLLAHLMKYFDKTNYDKYLGNIDNINLYFAIGSGVSLLVSKLFFFKSVFRNNGIRKTYENGIFFEETRVLAYITKGNKLCRYSQKLEEIFKAQKQKHEQFQLKSIRHNDKEIKIKKLEKALAKAEVDKVHKFVFTYANNFVLDLEVVKREILNKKDKVVGYVLVDNTKVDGYRTEASKEFKRYLFIYLDLLEKPIAYLDEDSGAYVLSNSLRKLMNSDQNELTPYELRDYMHPEDIFSYETKKDEDHKINQLFYRLRCGDDYLWFEESSGTFFGKNFILTRRVDSYTMVERLNFGGYKAMVKAVSHLTESNAIFSIAMLSFANIDELVSKRGQVLTDILINKFFIKIINGPLKSVVEIFKIGNNDYALIIEGDEYFDLIVHDLTTNSSDLLHQGININRSTIHLSAQIGLVFSKDFEEASAREIIKTGLTTLKEASDPDFLNDYSIYQPADIVEVEYDLDDLGIDLDEDLSEFLEDLDE